MSDIRDNDHHSALSSKTKRRRGRKSTASPGKVGEVGKALRSVYDDTLREDVPNDFLDLLGKLR